jgi:hypothetical protein
MVALTAAVAAAGLAVVRVAATGGPARVGAVLVVLAVLLAAGNGYAKAYSP